MLCLLMFFMGAVLVDGSSVGEDSKGYIKYEDPTGDKMGTEFVYAKCVVLDLEGVVTGDYKLSYYTADTGSKGCALLYKGPNIRNCEGPQDKQVKKGIPISLVSGDGHYWGMKHVESC